ncbi:MAG: 3-methyl-2-oxobutanoate hydroxymethyltransferase [Nanoarchaeota archaeon]|nr:3-methyl-2-oxobutanoate hydroxymethyltransferase [Nanoarchaeota archaeon]
MNIVSNIKSMKSKEKIVVLTCYDYSTAKILEEAGIDIILVGDSLGNVILGYDTTQKVTMQDIIRHTGAVRRGAPSTHIVADMPYKSDETKEEALKNAKLLIEAGADSVKLEGKPEICRFLVENKIQVMGHVGLLPQTAENFKVKGKEEKEAQEILNMAIELEKAGCYAVVLESVPSQLAKKITDSIKIPTIGIGAGVGCDGQVLVINDILGMFDDFKPKFVKRFANLKEEIKKAVSSYKKEVKAKTFPDESHSFK